MAYLIGLDDGHGISTAGKRTPPLKEDLKMNGKLYKKGSTIKENEFNDRIMKLVEKGLDKIKEINYIELASGEEDVSLANRVKIANNKKVDLVVSIHANALSGKWQEKAFGLVSIHTKNCSSKSISLAKNCHKYLSSEVKWYSNGANKYGVRTDVDLTGNTYYILRNTNMPATLLELGFMDNWEDVKNMVSDEFAINCARAIIKGVCDTLGVKYVESNIGNSENVNSNNVKDDVLYRVVIGSYGVKSNAEKAKKEAIKKGYNNAFIIEYKK